MRLVVNLQINTNCLKISVSLRETRCALRRGITGGSYLQDLNTIEGRHLNNQSQLAGLL